MSSWTAERHAADAVVLAAGAWSALLEGLPDAARPPVRPVKGQMLALRMDPEHPVLRHVLWAPKGYLVPRGDGRLIVGGTVEERGFDQDLTAGGVLALLEAAWRALPVVEELPIDELWVGFRPTSRDDAPILGPTSIEGLVLATGQHRNGILLTPDHRADGERSRPDRAGPGPHPRIHDRPLWRPHPGGCRACGSRGGRHERGHHLERSSDSASSTPRLISWSPRGSRDPRRVAVALNDAVVPRGAWPETRLHAGDRVEIVKITVGG